MLIGFLISCCCWLLLVSADSTPAGKTTFNVTSSISDKCYIAASNGNIQCQDNTMLATFSTPWRNFRLSFGLFPTAPIFAESSILALLYSDGKQVNIQVPSVNFQSDTTQLSIIIQQAENPNFPAVLNSNYSLPLQEWSKIEIELFGEVLSVVVSGKSISFTESILVPLPRTVVSIVQLYASSPLLPAAAAFIGEIKFCSTVELPKQPSPYPSQAPSTEVHYPSSRPSAMPTAAYTLRVPSPSSTPTSNPSFKTNNTLQEVEMGAALEYLENDDDDDEKMQERELNANDTLVRLEDTNGNDESWYANSAEDSYSWYASSSENETESWYSNSANDSYSWYSNSTDDSYSWYASSSENETESWYSNSANDSYSWYASSSENETDSSFTPPEKEKEHESLRKRVISIV